MLDHCRSTTVIVSCVYSTITSRGFIGDLAYTGMMPHARVRQLQLVGATSVGDNSIQRCTCPEGWLGSRVVRVLDSGTEGPGFKSQSRRCRLTVLGKLFTPIVPLFTKQQNW